MGDRLGRPQCGLRSRRCRYSPPSEGANALRAFAGVVFLFVVLTFQNAKHFPSRFQRETPSLWEGVFFEVARGDGRGGFLPKKFWQKDGALFRTGDQPNRKIVPFEDRVVFLVFEVFKRNSCFFITLFLYL
jgi:hypothetical protein